MRRLLIALCVLLACLASAQAFATFDFGWPLHRHMAPDAHYMLQQRLLQQRYRMEQERLCQQCASLSHTTPLDHVRFHVQENPTDYTLKAALPGIASHNVRLHTSPESHTLSVSAVRPVARGCEELVTPQRLERSFRLPASVDWDFISGTMEDGLLHITIPKLMPPPQPQPQPRLKEQAATHHRPAPQQQQQPTRTLTGWEQLEQLHNQLFQRMLQPQPESQHPQEPATQQPPLQQHTQQERIAPPRPPRQQQQSHQPQHQPQQQQTQSATSQPTRSPTVHSEPAPAPAPASHTSHTEPTLTIEEIDALLHLLDQTAAPAPTPSHSAQKQQKQKQQQPESSPSVDQASYLDPRTHEPLWHHTPAPSSCKGCAPRPRPRYADEGIIEL